MSDLLKPCPFCGSQPCTTTAPAGSGRKTSVFCGNYTCPTREVETHDYDDADEAAEAWNTRAGDDRDALQAEVAELKKLSSYSEFVRLADERNELTAEMERMKAHKRGLVETVARLQAREDKVREALEHGR